MPTYLNSNFIFTIVYTSVAPAVAATYTDTHGTVYTVQAVGSGTNLGKYAVTGVTPPAMYPSVSAVTRQTAQNLGTPPTTPTTYANSTVVLTKTSGTGDATVTLIAYTLVPVTIAGAVRIEAGQSVAASSYVLNLPWYAVQSLATPFYDNMIYSASLTTTTTVSVPTTVIDSSTGFPIPLNGNYVIKVYVGQGVCTVQLNNSVAVARYVGLYEHYDISCRGRGVGSIIVTISGTAAVYVSIEKI